MEFLPHAQSINMKRPVVFSCPMSLLLSMLSVAAVLAVRDPYTQIEADSMDFNAGASVETNTSASGGKYVSTLRPANYIGYSQLDFSEETAAFELQMWNQLEYSPGSQVQLRLDSPTSTPFLTFVTPHGGKRWILSTLLIPVDQHPRGVHDLYFTVQHPTPSTLVLGVDWFRFVTLHSLLPPSHTLRCPAVTTTVTCPDSQSLPTTDCCEKSDGKHIVVNIC